MTDQTPPKTGKRTLLINGHPDASPQRLIHALVQSYADGAAAGGHEVRRLQVAELDFALLRTQHAWEHEPLPPGLQAAQADIAWAEHVVLFFPLWLGDMPALVKGFLEQVLRPGFAFSFEGSNPFGRKGLKGRSARVVVTMGMPALVYRLYFRAHSVKALERNILGFVGFAPIDETLIGSVMQLGETGMAKWRARLYKLGRQAA